MLTHSHPHSHMPLLVLHHTVTNYYNGDRYIIPRLTRTINTTHNVSGNLIVASEKAVCRVNIDQNQTSMAPPFMIMT